MLQHCIKYGHVEMVSFLLGAGADPSAVASAQGTTARDTARHLDRQQVVQVIDNHLRHQQRPELINICLAFAATELPVLVLLELFAWSAKPSYASEVVPLPLEEQWRIAKLIRDRTRPQRD